MNQNPKISVIMSVYNGEKYLKEAIDSILNQSFTDFEFIIINDASTDKSLEILKSYDDTRIIIINNEKNLKLGASLNKGIELAKGKYIARMDDDDISHTDRLKIQYKFMENNPEIGVCGSWIMSFGRKFKTICKHPVLPEDIKASMIFYPCIVHPTVLIRKNILLNNKYSENVIRAEDYDLWAKLINQTKFYNIPKILLYFRRHSEKERKQAFQSQIKENTYNIRKTFLNFMEVNLSEKENETLKRFPENLNNEDSSCLKNLFKKILSQNKKVQYCNEKSLCQSICDVWTIIILKANPGNLKLIKEFILFPVPLINKIKSIYKIFLLRYFDIVLSSLFFHIKN